MSCNEEFIQTLLANNAAWASDKTAKDPAFFARLGEGAAPKILWIGCSDSRVPPTLILGLNPGDICVHRNVANLFLSSDLNAQASMQYALEVLHIEHIIVCGHTNCDAIAAALGDRSYGLTDNWLRHVKDLYVRHGSALAEIDPALQQQHVAELVVQFSVDNIKNSSLLQSAWSRGRRVMVHGWMYDIQTGLVREIGLHAAGVQDTDPIYRLRSVQADL